MEQYIGETKLKVYTCKNCGEDTIKVKLTESEEGEYVKIEDVLKLFGAEK